MIGKLTYEQVLTFAKEIRNEALVVEDMSRAREIEDLVEFADKVEAYAKFLENIVELNKDADKAIADLTGKK
ncbi:MAG: hypothetical protein IKQ06_04355 [Bacilli bacterium]|nr:hypothetical protein [Bacilli bacterium]